MGRIAGAAAACVVAAALLVGGAQSASLTTNVFTVDTTADTADNVIGDGTCADAGGHCSLRAAVQEADALGGSSVINLPAGTYTLSSGQLLFKTANISLSGAGARTTSIIQGGVQRVIEVASGTSVISGVLIQGGDTLATSGEPNAGVGGGIWIDSPGTLTVSHSTITHNVASASGGGIDNNGTLSVDHSTIDHNGAGTIGGGIDDFGPLVSISDSTISSNSAATEGGGLLSANTTTLTNDTFGDNQVTSSGPAGDVYVYGSADVIAVNTIFGSSPFSSDCNASLDSHGSNLASDASCGLAAAGDRQGVDPQLGALANNGGQTDTYLPAATSPALDAGLDGACPADDQRGNARPQGPHCDVGAVEVGSSGGGGANQPPVASFTQSTSGLRVTVDGSASSDPDGTIASYAWDFGDGSTGTGATAGHTYAGAGTFTVTLTVTDNAGATDATTRQVTVAPPGVSSGASLVQAGAASVTTSTHVVITVTLKDTTGAPVTGKSVRLSLTGGEIVLGAIPTVTDGNGTAQWTVTDTAAETVVYSATDSTDGIALTGTASVAYTSPPPPAAATMSLQVSVTGNGTITSNPAGISCPGACTASFPVGTTVQLEASPARHSLFGYWLGQTCSSPAGPESCGLTMTPPWAGVQTLGVVAHFDDIQPVPLVVEVAGSVPSGEKAAGQVVVDSPSIDCRTTCFAWAYPGDQVTLVPRTVAGGQAFARWSGACAGAGDCKITIAGATTVVAQFGVGAIPTNTALPTVAPTGPRYGIPATAALGAWSHAPDRYAVQWYRCLDGYCTAIPGATGKTYVPTADDVGDDLVVGVTASSQGMESVPAFSTPQTVGSLDRHSTDPVAVTTGLATVTFGGGAATLGGTFIAGDESWTQVGFNWSHADGTFRAFAVVPGVTVNSNATQELTASISNLTPGLTYRYQLVGTTADGATIAGAWRTFVAVPSSDGTSPIFLTADLEPATGQTPTRVHVTMLPGETPVVVTGTWTGGSQTGTIQTGHIDAGATPATQDSFYLDLNDADPLQTGLTYDFTLVASNGTKSSTFSGSGGVWWPGPTTTDFPTSITATSAYLSGTWSSAGGLGFASMRFLVPGQSQNPVQAQAEPCPTTCTLGGTVSDLTPGTTYTVQAVATAWNGHSDDDVAGQILHFTTPAEQATASYSGSTLLVGLGCEVATGCAGSFTIATPGPADYASGAVGQAARWLDARTPRRPSAPAWARRIVLGTGTFRIRAGKTRVARLTISPVGSRYLRAHPSLTALVVTLDEHRRGHRPTTAHSIVTLARR